MGSNPLRIVGNFVIFIYYMSLSVISTIGFHTTTNSNDQFKTVMCIAHKRLKVKDVTRYVVAAVNASMRLRQGPPCTLLGVYSAAALHQTPSWIWGGKGKMGKGWE